MRIGKVVDVGGWRTEQFRDCVGQGKGESSTLDGQWKGLNFCFWPQCDVVLTQGLVLFLWYNFLHFPGPTTCNFMLEKHQRVLWFIFIFFICTLSAGVAVAFLSTHVSLTRRDATWIHVKDNRQVESTSLLQEVSEIFFSWKPEHLMCLEAVVLFFLWQTKKMFAVKGL